MVADGKIDQDTVQEVWREYLATGDVPEFVNAPWFSSKRLRPFFLHIPAEPRCRTCFFPFEGLGGKLMRSFFGVSPAKMNPHICNLCENFLTRFPGGVEVELTIFFADVRGSTRLAEKMNPTQFSQLINRFYNVTSSILFESEALVEKLIGDAVTAIFTPGFGGQDHAKVAIESARKIMKATGHGSSSAPWVPLGIGIHTGRAFVGSVTSDLGVKDIAVLGDTANTGARLASLAAPGEIAISQETAKAAGLDADGINVRQVELKGRQEPVEVWVL
ncbi:MAG: adenylate/guanylate cyclase domain-containing protein [Anaerolineales bacterium]|nr:adenylate/guanylate cyclase domain-containing protein [Anaerolineales bacterium]